MMPLARTSLWNVIYKVGIDSFSIYVNVYVLAQLCCA